MSEELKKLIMKKSDEAINNITSFPVLKMHMLYEKNKEKDISHIEMEEFWYNKYIDHIRFWSGYKEDEDIKDITYAGIEVMIGKDKGIKFIEKEDK